MCNEQKGGVAIRVYTGWMKNAWKVVNATQETEEVERVFSGLKVVSPKARLGIEMHHAKGTSDSELGFVALLW